MKWKLGLLGVAFLVVFSAALQAHETRPAYLQLRQTGAETFNVLWKVPAVGNLRLSIYLKLPQNCSTTDTPTKFMKDNAYLEQFTARCAGGLADRSIVSFPGVEATITNVFVQVAKLDGSTMEYLASPAKPFVELRGQRSWFNVAEEYVALGFHHIMLGVDHLLFVLGLLLIVRGTSMLLKTISAFTLAHSITLGIATLGYASAPIPPLNVAIALSILFLGPEIVRSWNGETSLTIRYPWIVAFCFGLLHGFGFASGLSTTGMAHAEIPLALLSFNGGVELGQLVFVGLILLMARSFRILEMRWPIWVERLPGYTVGVCGAFWTIDRTIMMLAAK